MQSRRSFLLSLVSVPIVLAACGSDDKSSSTTAAPGTTAGGSSTTGAATTGAPTTAAATTTAAAAATTAATAGSAPAASNLSGSLRLGYFPNITHAPALVGVQQGLFAKALGDGVKLDTSTYNSGTEAIEALFADAIDASFIGPNPAINGYVKSNGEALRIVSGSTSGGAYLVVKPEITSAADLKGKTLATPQLGNTQDVALRTWLKSRASTRTPRAAATWPSCRRRTRPRSTRSSRRHRRRLAARAVGDAADPGGRRQGARRRGDAVARGQVRHHPPDRRHQVPERSPGHRQGAPPGRARRARLHRRQPGRCAEGGQRADQLDHPEAAQGRCHRRVVVQPRPSPTTRSPRPCRRARTTPRPSACSTRST